MEPGVIHTGLRLFFQVISKNTNLRNLQRHFRISGKSGGCSYLQRIIIPIPALIPITLHIRNTKRKLPIAFCLGSTLIELLEALCLYRHQSLCLPFSDNTN